MLKCNINLFKKLFLKINKIESFFYVYIKIVIKVNLVFVKICFYDEYVLFCINFDMKIYILCYSICKWVWMVLLYVKYFLG